MTVHLVKAYTNLHGAVTVCEVEDATMLATPEAVDQVTCENCLRPMPEYTTIFEGSPGVNLTGSRPYMLAADLANGRHLVERVSDGQLYLILAPHVSAESCQRWAERKIRELMNKGDL